MTITIESIKNYNPELALYNKILDNLKSTYKYHKTVSRSSDKTPLELLVIVNGERERIFKDTPGIYNQALQALIDLVNGEVI